MDPDILDYRGVELEYHKSTTSVNYKGDHIFEIENKSRKIGFCSMGNINKLIKADKVYFLNIIYKQLGVELLKA